VPGVDLINRDQCRNGQPSLEVYMAQFTATQRSSTINGSITNGSFWPNGYLAVTVSSVWESTSPSLYAASWLTWTRYALLQAPPPNIRNSTLHSRSRTTYRRRAPGRLDPSGLKVVSTSTHQGLLHTLRPGCLQAL
jgi:hypothetical protein